jgi:hypothetical protein
MQVKAARLPLRLVDAGTGISQMGEPVQGRAEQQLKGRVKE